MPNDKGLCTALADITDVRDMQRFLQELLTPKEFEDVSRRWQILTDLCFGVPQREIANRYQMSLCKITRGSRVLHEKGSICKAVIEKRLKK